MNNGCKDCTDRFVGCHTNCKTYNDYVSELNERKQKISKAKKKNAEYRAFKDKQVLRAYRRNK